MCIIEDQSIMVATVVNWTCHPTYSVLFGRVDLTLQIRDLDSQTSSGLSDASKFD